MKNKEQVLVLSADPEISSVIMRLIGDFEGYEGTLCQSVDTLSEILSGRDFHILLIGAGFVASEEEEMTRVVGSRFPGIRKINHYGGGSGLLYAELQGHRI